ncbi:MAG: Serine-rich adhesin, platelet-type [Candidatus Magasanikbacteria bacterium GW2011_GWC2_45_8]|uniref:Serine-rich adhesin, platelet-type n=1 Tax=Candidatus Magasanikbacteria bacterium GW2011_GWC2_45_8 TaxID=1619050 RepID=A0A0G1MYE7_9BACT|nr:MAG: Serine-rich adhesin, platelet-type [Candidatus Magasanikbacteria bacterium GW2011_GWC2_45_8]
MHKRRENFKTVFFGALFFVFVFFNAQYAHAYDTFVGHAGITELSAKLFNTLPSGHQLTDEQIQWLKQGAVEEDTPFRWMNHFYDPVHNQGLKGEFLSSKAWVNDQAKQARYSKGDHTWDRALFDYHKGLEKDAFIALGHVLHLIEDATVPAHTRDDAHPAGDPLENWVKDHWPVDASKAEILKLKDLDAYFDHVANFSNNNFYSEDTIESKNYKRVKIVDEIFANDQGVESAFEIALIGKNKYKLFKKVGTTSWNNDKNPNGNTERASLKSDLIGKDYSSLLVPKAVSAGAGVISLFFDTYETEPQKKVLIFQTHPLGVVQEVLVDAGYGSIETWNKFKNTAQNLYQEVKQNFWQITDIFEAAKIGYNIFKVNTALAATLEHASGQTALQPSLIQHTYKDQSQNTSNQTVKNNQTSEKSSVVSSLIASDASQVLLGAGGTQRQGKSLTAVPLGARILPIIHNLSNANQQLPPSSSSSSGSTSGGGALSGGSPSSGGGTGSFSNNSTGSTSGDASSSSSTDSNASNSAQNNQSSEQQTKTQNQTSSIASSTTTTSSTSATSTPFIFLDPPTIDTPSSTIVLASATSTTSSTSSSTTIWTTFDTLVLSGTRPASSTAVFVNQNAIGVILSTSTWSAPTTLQNGKNIFNVFAQNAEGATSSITSATIWRDSEAPTSTLIYVSTSTQAVLQMNITWSAADALSGVAYFDVQIASSTPSASSTSPLVWQPFFSHTTSTIATFSGIDGVTYYFRMRAADALGNISEWTSGQNSQSLSIISSTANLASFTPSLSHSVVINEIAWSGTKVNATDEWMELMNTGASAVDLAGFRLTAGSKIDFTFATGTIPGYGYWLLERKTSATINRIGVQGSLNGGVLFGTSDGGIELLLSTGPKMRVGTVYTGALTDDGETLSLYDTQGVLIDHIDASSGWFAGAKAGTKTQVTPPRSMQRIDPRASGELSANWETNNGTLINGSDALMNALSGTPLQPNRGYTSLIGTLASSTTLTAQKSPYHLYSFTVPAGVILTVEPGVLVKAYNVSLTVDGGSLNVLGDVTHPVVFTSVYDTVYGAPPLDYAPTSYHADYWHGIAGRNGAKVSLNQSILTKSGYQYVAGTSNAVLDAGSGASLVLNNILIQDVDRLMVCSGLGSNITMTNSTVRRVTYSGVIVSDCSLTIEKSSFSDIHWGTFIDPDIIFGVKAHGSKTRLDKVNFQNIKGTGILLDKSLDGTLVRDSTVSDSPTGINIIGGMQTLDNVLFKNLSLGIKQTGFATTTFKNITDQNFINVTTITTPAGLF